MGPALDNLEARLLTHLREETTALSEACLGSLLADFSPEFSDPPAMRECLAALEERGFLSASRALRDTVWWSSNPAGRQALSHLEAERSHAAGIRSPYLLQLTPSGAWALTLPQDPRRPAPAGTRIGGRTRMGTFDAPAQAAEWIADACGRLPGRRRRRGPLADTLATDRTP